MTPPECSPETAFVAAPPADAEPAGATVVIRPQRGWRGVDFAELWQYRELLYFFVWRDVKVRYKQTVIGAAWALIQPVCTMVIFAVIFGRFAGIPSEGVPYPVFCYAGLLPWLLFANGVSQASLSLVNQAHLLTKVYFPRLFIPAASIGVSVVDFALGFTVYVGMMAWFGYWPGMAVVLLPALVVLTAAAAYGVGVLLAGVTVAYRDFRLVVPFMVQIWLYLSPVVYPVTMIPPAYRWLLLLNPITGIINAFRSVLLDRPLDWVGLAIATGETLLILTVGVANFRRTERRFADVA